MRKITFFCILGFALPVSAIVVEHYNVAEGEPSSAGQDLDWRYVYNYKGSSAVAVGGGWLLTAGHVADDDLGTPGSGSFTNEGTHYQQQEIVYCPDTDLALVRFDKAFPGHYGLYTSEAPTQDLPGLRVLMVGFGATGSISTNYFTDSGAGKDTKRWGSQIIDRTLIKRYDSDGTVQYTKNRGFVMDFIYGDTSHEAGGGAGDSGGGVFYNDGGVWKLTGIMTSRSGGAQYAGTFAVSIPDYADWIADTIPEPAAMGLTGFGTIGLFLARSRRRRKLAGRSLFPIEHACDMFVAQDQMTPAFTQPEGKERRKVLSQTGRNVCALVSNSVQQGYRRFDQSIWSHLTAAFERERVRMQTVRVKYNRAFNSRLDRFLEKVNWDWMVSAHTALKKDVRAAFRWFLP